jgi:hypothetical protein
MLVSLSPIRIYLLVAEAASFDKKELCRSDTSIICYIYSFLEKIAGCTEYAGTSMKILIALISEKYYCSILLL